VRAVNAAAGVPFSRVSEALESASGSVTMTVIAQNRTFHSARQFVYAMREGHWRLLSWRDHRGEHAHSVGDQRRILVSSPANDLPDASLARVLVRAQQLQRRQAARVAWAKAQEYWEGE